MFNKKDKFIQNMYFVSKGDKFGQFLVFLKFNKKNKKYQVLNLPDNNPLIIDEKDVLDGLNNKILEHVDTIPKDVFKVCKKEFELKSKLINN